METPIPPCFLGQTIFSQDFQWKLGAPESFIPHQKLKKLSKDFRKDQWQFKAWHDIDKERLKNSFNEHTYSSKTKEWIFPTVNSILNNIKSILKELFFGRTYNLRKTKIFGSSMFYDIIKDSTNFGFAILRTVLNKEGSWFV